MSNVRYIGIGTVMDHGGALHVCVRIGPGSAKIVPLRNRDWKDPKTVVDETELGVSISAGTAFYMDEGPKWCSWRGQMNDNQIIARPEIKEMSKPKELGYVIMPFPGQNKKGKIKSHAPAEATEISDHNPMPVAPIPAGKINEVMLAMKQGAAVFENMLTSRIASPGA